jgi:hypothetical protein
LVQRITCGTHTYPLTFVCLLLSVVTRGMLADADLRS